MKRILVLGKGLVGESIRSYFENSPNEIRACSTEEVDLRVLSEVKSELRRFNPDIAIYAAGVSGGIQANIQESGSLAIENLLMMSNFLYAARAIKLPELINLVPACVYPGSLKKNMSPKDLFMGPMEESSLGYSTSKLAGLVTCQAIAKQEGLSWKSVIVTNLYGTSRDNVKTKPHVIPDLVNKFSQAKKQSLGEVELLGSGLPVRDFLHVSDLGIAVETILNYKGDETIINVSGSGAVTIAQLARKIAKVVDYKGVISFNGKDLDGTDYKVLDGNLLRSLGWEAKTSLDQGLKSILNQQMI